MSGSILKEVDAKVGASAKRGPVYPVVGEIISHKLLNPEEVVSTITRKWKESIYGKVDITHLKHNRYLFSFTEATLAVKVIEEGPWTVMGHFLCLALWDSDVKLEMIRFSRIPIWVQVHGLMSSYMNRQNAERIGNGIGEFLEVDEKSLSPLYKRGYLRVKVLLDCYAVVKTGLWVDLQNDHGSSKHREDYKYERMADLCYKCGRFGHFMDDCEEEGVPHPQFGPWLKATEVAEGGDEKDDRFDVKVDIQDKIYDRLVAPVARGRGGRDKMDKRLNLKCDDMLNCLLEFQWLLIVALAVIAGIAAWWVYK